MIVIKLPFTPDEETFQKRVQAVWEHCIAVDPHMPRAWVEAHLRERAARERATGDEATGGRE